MAVRTIAELKALFESGDRPTQQDFWDLFETMLTVETWPSVLPAASAQNLTNIPIPDPLPAVSGEFLTNLNRSDWVTVPGGVAYVTGTSFKVDGDYTGTSWFVVGRRVRLHLIPSGYYFGVVTAASYAAGPDETTVTVDLTIPTSALASVDVSLLVDSDIVITSLQPGSGPVLSVYRKDAGGTNVEAWSIPVSSGTSPGLVELATSTEVLQLADAVRAVTPAGLAALLATAANADRAMLRDGAGRSQVQAPAVALDVSNKAYTDGEGALAANGYMKFPGGLIVQWGTVYAIDPGVYVTNLPVAFPTAGLWGVAGVVTNKTTQQSAPHLVSVTASQITVRATANDTSFAWLAIGH